MHRTHWCHIRSRLAVALAKELLRELVEINTTQSAGNTTTASEVIAKRLRAAGFPEQDLVVGGSTPNRGNLVARLRSGCRRGVQSFSRTASCFSLPRFLPGALVRPPSLNSGETRAQARTSGARGGMLFPLQEGAKWLHADVLRGIELRGRFWISTAELQVQTFFRIQPVHFRTRVEHAEELLDLPVRECEAGRAQ